MNPTFARLAPALLAAPFAGLLSWQYSPYTPLSMAIAVGLFAWTAISSAFNSLLEAWLRKTFRCPQDGCDFTVSLKDVDAAETRWWQDLAHAHPHRSTD